MPGKESAVIIMGNNEENLLDIKKIQMLVKQGDIVWRDHAMKRLRERKITKDDVRRAIDTGMIIEDRPDDIPTPCCVILGYRRSQNNCGFEQAQTAIALFAYYKWKIPPCDLWNA